MFNDSKVFKDSFFDFIKTIVATVDDLLCLAKSARCFPFLAADQVTEPVNVSPRNEIHRSLESCSKRSISLSTTFLVASGNSSFSIAWSSLFHRLHLQYQALLIAAICSEEVATNIFLQVSLHPF